MAEPEPERLRRLICVITGNDNKKLLYESVHNVQTLTAVFYAVIAAVILR
jgi:hypothetical protein